MRMYSVTDRGWGGGSNSRNNCRASEKLAPSRHQIFPVPLYIGRYSVGKSFSSTQLPNQIKATRNSPSSCVTFGTIMSGYRYKYKKNYAWVLTLTLNVQLTCAMKDVERIPVVSGFIHKKLLILYKVIKKALIFIKIRQKNEDKDLTPKHRNYYTRDTIHQIKGRP